MSAVIDDELWSAIGDPTRRRILDLLLADGASTATALSQHLPVSRQAIAKHIAVLGGAGLVKGYVVGRERRYDVDQEQLARAVAELASVHAVWDARLSRIKRLAEAIEKKRNL
jgi:DNA-binding transcriptional ArsR family regulator